jgi:hypothetical protein
LAICEFFAERLGTSVRAGCPAACWQVDSTMPKRSIAQPSAPIALGIPQLTEGIDAWFIKAVLVEFLATLLFLFISISTAGRLGICAAWALPPDPACWCCC